MGRRSRQSFVKRAKEKKRQEKAAIKRRRRLERKRGESPDELSENEVTEIAANTGSAVAGLVLIGLQNDFFPGGALGVAGGGDVLPVANRLIEEFSQADLPIVATCELHPPAHCSFKDQGGDWPPHCVADSPGADFHPDLRLPNDATIVTMGMHPNENPVSGFDETDLARNLRTRGVAEIVICGLATEYGVKATAVDGRREGLEVTVVQEGIRGIDDDPARSVEALQEMERAGVRVVTAGTLVCSPMT